MMFIIFLARRGKSILFFSPHVSILNKTFCAKKLYKNNADGIEKSVEIEL